ncbi:VIT family-domain-containing protein [Podospora conica]|nr:VIT family-domain-containing protein [Schizothecium conicum]
MVSLVGIKNLFFPSPPQKNDPYTHKDGAKSATSLNDHDSLGTNSTLVDLESQDRHPRKKDGFRIDARVISDATIGLSDGLTVPFALTAGLSALGNTKVVIFGGLAELIAGAISMGLGGYLGAKSEIASYHEALSRVTAQTKTNPTATISALHSALGPLALPPATLDAITSHLNSPTYPRESLVPFLMRFDHPEEPSPSRALTSALTIALAYFFGGLVPLLPYFCIPDPYRALYVSVGVMVVALFVFGYAKTGFVVGFNRRGVMRSVGGGVQMVFVGGIAAGAAMGLVKAFGGMMGNPE